MNSGARMTLVELERQIVNENGKWGVRKDTYIQDLEAKSKKYVYRKQVVAHRARKLETCATLVCAV